MELDAAGDAYLDVFAPHTVTEWVAEAFCTNTKSSLAVSNKSTLLVSQDFFVDVGLPYSVKRGEILHVNVTTFNKVETALPIKLSLAQSDEYNIRDADSRNVCLDGQRNQLEIFKVEAKVLGEVNITAKAEITDEVSSDSESSCTSAGGSKGYTDAVRKSIIVKPEGLPKEKIQSAFQCLDLERTEFTLDLSLPDDLVEGSERAWIKVSGDIMAPSLNNLERLLDMPTGCGEQNMIGMAPNVYLLDYIQGIGRSEPEIFAKAKEFMTRGYERQMRFRHSNGAYSVWGPQDETASLWLTSFVVKVFSEAAKYIQIQNQTVADGVQFMLGLQNQDGCFNNSGFVLHPDLGGTDMSVTASTLVALLEVSDSGVAHVDEEAIQGALNCVRTNVTDELYTKSLITYALSLNNRIREAAEQDEVAQTLLAELLSIANKTATGEKLYWLDPASKSRSVEITAYNVLSLVLQDKMPEALSGVRWLASQRNALGGFVSTQDTVVALKALTEYSIKAGSSLTEIMVQAVEEQSRVEHYFEMTDDDKLLLQSERLVALPTNVSVEIRGSGCYMLQSVLKYSVKEPPRQKSFLVTASQSETGRVAVCARYIGPKVRTGMVLVEMELLSGFAAVPSSLETLRMVEGVKKVEASDGKVVVYLDRMERLETCWRVVVKRTAVVQGLKSAEVKVYEYYAAENAVSVTYNIETDGEDNKVDDDAS